MSPLNQAADPLAPQAVVSGGHVHLAQLAAQGLRILLLDAAGPGGLSLAALHSVLRLAQKAHPTLQLTICALQGTDHELCANLQAERGKYDLCLLLAEADSPALPPAVLQEALLLLQGCPFFGATGVGVLWLAQAGLYNGLQAALPWPLHAELDARCDQAQLNLHLYEFDQRALSCCGGAASLDFALFLVQLGYGPALQNRIKEALCVDNIRLGSERQREALQERALPPKLVEVLALMQANIEEPLGSDDLANLVDISRRQLERLFKQYLNNLPSRYYLELRLNRARQLLIESHHSIVQIGLMCGFSSGSHFSTAFSTLFGITPREERQRKLKD